MAFLAIGSFLLGAVFGQYFKVWILIPACGVIFAVAFGGALYHGQGLPFAALEFVLLVTCLQAGFVCRMISCVLPSLWRQLKQPRQSSRPAASIAATRHR